MKRTSLIITLLVIAINCLAETQNITKGPSPISVIFETDMGNDIDDALALDMVYKYVDQSKFNLLAIMNNKDSKCSAEFIDIMNTWYGYPNIPIGNIEGGVEIDDYVNYAENVCKLEEDGEKLFKRSLGDYTTLPPSHVLYRKILAAQPDNSVTIISVGFSTNLARLLDTSADEYSTLTGVELVNKKVKLLSVMGGSLTENPRKEFNIVHDIKAAQKMFKEWPTQIVVSPFELGVKVQFQAKVIENDFDWGVRHPLVEGYLHYRPMPYNRATWDLTSVLYVAEEHNNFMNISASGQLTVTDEGITIFTQHEEGRHKYLTSDKEQVARMEKRFTDLITTKPKSMLK